MRDQGPKIRIFGVFGIFSWIFGVLRVFTGPKWQEINFWTLAKPVKPEFHGFWSKILDFRILGFLDFRIFGPNFGFLAQVFLKPKRIPPFWRSKCRRRRPEIVHMRRKTKDLVFGPSSSFPGWTGHPRLHIFPGRRRMAFSPGYNFPGSQAKNYSQVPRFVSPGSFPQGG